MPPKWTSVDADVYISAGPDDADKADWLYSRLQDKGIRCWVASRGRDPGLRYGTIDDRPIIRSRLMIAVPSGAGDQRAVSIAERRAAAVAALPIISIQAADIPELIDVDQLLYQINTRFASKLPIRVFIFSPEGTEDERRILRPLIDRVQEDLLERVRLDPVFWPETEVNEPSEIDIVVFLVWAHIYTRLPRPFSGRLHPRRGRQHGSCVSRLYSLVDC